ncbi:predicted protein [Nematostella vectensis]|uniref:Uncharacterized protein n=1 Tax=Nematostella vectensis TaxID=45351 RepID=A7S1T3_NEMVE|nr:predicted protein [Nematostella vectensis]|eukprot:XP_001634358.1 predicted protein [Nematostella vectensis]
MTSVMPAWKQELIEKKRRREREQHNKIEESQQRLASVPEWKRNILEKKKREAHNSNDDSKNSTSGTGVFGAKATRKDSQIYSQPSGSNREERFERNAVTESAKPIVNKRSNDLRVNHSGVVSSEPRHSVQQQSQGKQGVVLSNDNVMKNTNNSMQSHENSDLEVKVAYEHVRPPSELRKLFGESTLGAKKLSSDTTSISALKPDAGITKTGIVPPGHDTVLNGSEIELSELNKTAVINHTTPRAFQFTDVSQTLSAIKHTEQAAKSNENTFKIQNNNQSTDVSKLGKISLKKEEFESVGHQKARSQSIDSELSVSKEDEESKLLPHVDDIRCKFGPVGRFHRTSSSVENLSVCSSDGTVSPVFMRPQSKKRPGLKKRWTADISSLMSPSMSIDDHEDDQLPVVGSKHEDRGMTRQRSISMHDLGHETIQKIHFRHRASISHGIERRVHELLRQVSHSDSHTEDDLDSFSIESEHHYVTTILPPPAFQTDEPERLQTSSWTETASGTGREEFKRTLPTAALPTAMGRKREVETPPNYKKVILIEKTEENLPDNIEITSFKEPARKCEPQAEKIYEPQSKKIYQAPEQKTQRLLEKQIQHPVEKAIQHAQEKKYQPELEKKTIKSHHVPGQDKTEARGEERIAVWSTQNGDYYDQRDEDDDIKLSKGSVSKLSALFGSSIKGGKKEKNKEAKAEYKRRKEEEKQEAKLKKGEEKQEAKLRKEEEKKNKDSKSNGNKMFPWNKSNKKVDEQKSKLAETSEYPFKNMTKLRHVQSRPIEQKISVQMTLVLDSNADSLKTIQPKTHYFDNSFLNKNKSVSGDQGRMNGHQENAVCGTYKAKQDIAPSVPVTPIDLPLPRNNDKFVTTIDISDSECSNDLEVSAIDVPESPKLPAPVSVIDLPPADDVAVSVIDVPEEFQDNESDEVDSDDSDSGVVSGSYDITIGTHPLILSFGEREKERESKSCPDIQEEEEEEEDIDDCPVHYFGDSSYQIVPKVVFEHPPEKVKPCISQQVKQKKDKAKVCFPSGPLHQVHDYPSEETLQSHYDQFLRESGKSINNYKPSTIESYEETLKLLQQKRMEAKTAKQGEPDSGEVKSQEQKTNITYADDADGFISSSSSSGALLF